MNSISSANGTEVGLQTHEGSHGGGLDGILPKVHNSMQQQAAAQTDASIHSLE